MDSADSQDVDMAAELESVFRAPPASIWRGNCRRWRSVGPLLYHKPSIRACDQQTIEMAQFPSARNNATAMQASASVDELNRCLFPQKRRVKDDF